MTYRRASHLDASNESQDHDAVAPSPHDDAGSHRRVVLFASFGIVLSTWAVHLPSLKQAVGISNAMTGT